MSDFIYSLNIARRQIQSYPPGHPVIAAAADKLLRLLPRLLEFRSEITIGIARDTLLVGGQALDRKNPIYRDLAVNLFDSKVASLTINQDLTAAEICKFFEILRYNAEELADRGGLHRILILADIKGIRAQGIDFGAFHATEVDKVHAPKTKLIEDETTVLWKSFVNGMVAGTIDPDGKKLTSEIQLDPALLAEIMNREEGVEGKGLIRNYEDAITSFLKKTDSDQLQSQASRETLKRLGELVGNLKPELRRRFLNSTLASCSGREDVATEVFVNLPQAQILEALEQVDNDQLEVPQVLMDVLGKLAQQKGSEAGGSCVTGQRQRPPVETADLLSQLFSADQADVFVPADYQDALSLLAEAEPLQGLDQKVVKDLVGMLDGHKVEQSFSNVMVDLLDRKPAEVTVQAISRNIEDLVFYFLETGDFIALNSLHDNLSQHARHLDALINTTGKAALQVYAKQEFVEFALDGLSTWGKPKYTAIKGLIKRVGVPFATPLLECLSEEPSMSKRHLFMECLLEIGPAARNSVIARLQDKRWFFVRNMVILLREMNDPSILQPLGHLVGFKNANVQHEVMRTFLYFKDPRADRYLLRELDSNDPGVLLSVIRLASNSRDPEVARKLSEILNRKPLKETGEIVKRAVLKSLAEIALPEALPGLKRFLFSRRRLFQSMQEQSLKLEAVRTLARFSDPGAAALAELVYQKFSGELARVAGQVCLQLKGKLPWI